jgi:hypothetical protein
MANNYQLAALRGDDGPLDKLRQEADRHWRAAHESHLRSVEDEEKAENAKKSSSG